MDVNRVGKREEGGEVLFEHRRRSHERHRVNRVPVNDFVNHVLEFDERLRGAELEGFVEQLVIPHQGFKGTEEVDGGGRRSPWDATLNRVEERSQHLEALLGGVLVRGRKVEGRGGLGDRSWGGLRAGREEAVSPATKGVVFGLLSDTHLRPDRTGRLRYSWGFGEDCGAGQGFMFNFLPE